jgi:class 3 adenylate cyclase
LSDVKALPQVAFKVEFYLKVSVAMNSGKWMFGNIGSKPFKRLDYTAIGDEVNAAKKKTSKYR